MTAVSVLSNRSLRSVYNYARRPILRTGLRPVQLFLVIIIIAVADVVEGVSRTISGCVRVCVVK